MTEFSAVVQRTTLIGNELVLGASDDAQSVPQKYALSDINAYNGHVNVLDYGADPTGAVDATSAFQSALDAADGALEVRIPSGLYTINGTVDIPYTTGCLIQPVGAVTIQLDNSRDNGAFSFAGQNNLSATAAVTLVADETNWPASGDPVTTRITGSFAGYEKGDLVNIMTAATDGWGLVESEWFYVAKATSTYIITNRKLFFTYDAASNTTTCKRMTNKPKVIIRRGITFQALGDTRVDVVGREVPLQLRNAWQAEIDFETRDIWNAAALLYGCVEGSYRLSARDNNVLYDIGALGYGLQLMGCNWLLELEVTGTRIGHLTALNGHGTAYDASNQGYHGAPMEIIHNRMRGYNCARSVCDSHYSIRCVWRDVYVVGSQQTEDTATKNDIAISLTGIDQRVDMIVAHNVRYLATVSTQHAASTISIRNHSVFPADTPIFYDPGGHTVDPTLDISD